MARETEKVLKKLGERVVYLRKKSGKTQTALAYDMDWEKDNLRKIERGKLNLTLDTLLKLSRALNIPLRDLFKDIE